MGYTRGGNSSPCLDELLFEQTQPKPQAHPFSLLSQSLPASGASAVACMGAASAPPLPLPLQTSSIGGSTKQACSDLFLRRTAVKPVAGTLVMVAKLNKYLRALCLTC